VPGGNAALGHDAVESSIAPAQLFEHLLKRPTFFRIMFPPWQSGFEGAVLLTFLMAHGLDTVGAAIEQTFAPEDMLTPHIAELALYVWSVANDRTLLSEPARLLLSLADPGSPAHPQLYRSCEFILSLTAPDGPGELVEALVRAGDAAGFRLLTKAGPYATVDRVVAEFFRESPLATVRKAQLPGGNVAGRPLLGEPQPATDHALALRRHRDHLALGQVSGRRSEIFRTIAMKSQALASANPFFEATDYKIRCSLTKI
jgi:hypothetical protein